MLLRRFFISGRQGEKLLLYRLDVKQSDRRTVSLSVAEDGTVLLKAPVTLTGEEIKRFLQKHDRWIEKQIRLREEQREKAAALNFTPEQVAALKERARVVLERRVVYYSERMGVRPAGVGITSARTRWGSCSGKNRLNFSYRLILLPPDAVDYVVVHELAHIRVKNHGAGFYREVEKYLPDYRQRIAVLKQAQRELGL